MRKGQGFLERFTEEVDLFCEPLPGRPLVEIAGDQRVLIENHRGVNAYGQQQIIVNVSFGSLSVCGCGLEILRMTKEQLVIHGKISGISLHRRNSE